MTPSASTSSKLSSYSSVSLSLSSTFGQGSDGESHGSGSFQMSRKKKFSYKEQQQPQLRCLCYLDVTLDQQQQQEQRQYQHQHQHQHQRQHEAPQQTKTRLLSTPSWYPKKHQKEASRLRRIWNDSTIFHWSKPSGTSRRGQLSQEEQSMQGSQQQHTVGAAESLFVQNSGLEGAPMRNSLSGTDISDEGNHTLTDVEDDCDDEDESTSSTNSGSRPQRVPLQEHFGTKPTTRTARPGDDLKAISRHQAELNQEPGRLDYNDYLMEDQPPQQEGRPLATSFAAGEVLDEDDDDDEDWDIQSDSGAPSSSPMYSAEAREPTSYSTVTLPLSQQTTTTPMAKGGYMKKPSNANLNSLRSRQRCLSLPADAGHRGFYKMSSRPSENWDEDFDIEEADINVPTNVVESQISLQMDIYNIKDFALQIEDLKTLRTSLRMASNSLKATNPKKHQDLSMLFQRDWEQAEVIIDLGEIAQTSTSPSPLPSLSSTSGTTGPAMAAGPLSAKKSSQHLQQLQSASSIGKATSQGLRRPALSTTTGPTIASSMPSHMALATALTTTAETRSISQSSTLVDSEEMRSVTSSRSSSGLTTIGVEPATEGWAIGGERRRPNLGAAVAPLKKQGSKMVMTESFSNSSSVLGVECTTPATPLPGYLENQNQDQSQDEAGEKWKVMSSGNGVAAEIEASFRRYQKYSGRHSHPKGRSSSSGNRSRIPSYDDEYEEDDDDDDGYESYGYGGNSASSQSSSSVGVITPIPSDRHMQVLKDILMEGLGRDVARQYMFKHGEQDHVRFSVEVIPGLLGHLKGLQQRLGDQLMELQALTIVA
ncbi:hypothetical protein BGZ54_009138 [Gamsiella multidivaricata]|nr:hypothetical protein BGZ54_009138 [Gamsiella multidivaricata]